MKPLSDRNVALIHYSCPPVIGGAEFILEAQARWFHRYGADVEVIVGEGDRFHDDIPVHTDERLASDSTAYDSVEYMDRETFDRHVNELETDLAQLTSDRNTLLVHNLLTMPFNMVATETVRRLVKRESLQSFAWTHDIAWVDEKYELVDEYPWNQLKQSADVTSYVAISQLRRDQLNDLFDSGPDIEVIHDAVEFDVFHELDPVVSSIYRDHSMYRSDIIAIYPARIVRRKNFEFALKIVGKLKQMGYDIHFIVTGPPDPHNEDSMDYFEELLELRAQLGLEDEVIFCYELENPETGDRLEVDFNRVRQLYRISDVLLLTSRQEGFGLPILEAGLTRTVICCSDIDPLPEVGGEAPVYFDLDEAPATVAEQIDEHLQTQDTVHLQRRVRKGFTWPAVFEKQMVPLMNEQFPLRGGDNHGGD